MTKYDTSNMAPGMVYEIAQDKNKKQFEDPWGYNTTYGADATFMVISSVRANSKLNTVIVAPVIDYDESDEFGVQHIIRRGGTTVTKTVCVDRMFKIQKKRLCKYRYSVASDILQKINEAISKMFFGELLYTKVQAYALCYKEEMAMRVQSIQQMARNAPQMEIPVDGAEYETAEFCEPAVDIKPKSHAEEEAEFARKMMTNPEPVIASVTIKDSEPVKPKKKSSIVITKDRKDISPRAKKNTWSYSKISKQKIAEAVEKVVEEVSPKAPRGKYANIYDHWEDFLVDYSCLSNDELMGKYGIPNITTLYGLGKKCKEIAVENGLDPKDFRRKPSISTK